MDRRGHFFTGMLILLVFSFFNVNEINALLFLFGNILPDIIEPAKNFNHRKFFHSQRILLILIMLVIFFFLIDIKKIVFLFLGYITHLLCDSITPMGLPF